MQKVFIRQHRVCYSQFSRELMHFFTFVDSIFVLQYIIRMCIDVIALANKSNQIALHLLRNVLSHQVPYL